MDAAIRVFSIAELADEAARIAVTTFEPQRNPFELGTADAIEWARRYELSLLRHSTAEDGEVSA